MAIVAVEGSLSLTVVNEAEGVIAIFGGEYAPETARAGKAEGVVGGEGVVRDCRDGDGTGNGTEGGVVVVSGNAIAGFKVNKFGDVLITIKSVEEFTVATSSGEKRSRRHRFSWVPCRISPRKMSI